MQFVIKSKTSPKLKPQTQDYRTQGSDTKPKAKPEQKQNAENTHAQLVKNNGTKSTKSESDNTSQILLKIMAKLDNQKKANKMILERISKLCY